MPKTIHGCEGCRGTFLAYASERRRYCSLACVPRGGAANPNYNGGLCVRDDGRTVIFCRDGSLLYFYRGLMAAHIGRLLRSDEIVHHLNGDQGDDRIENLTITTRAAHIETHRDDLLAAAGRTRRAAS